MYVCGGERESSRMRSGEREREIKREMDGMMCMCDGESMCVCVGMVCLRGIVRE